MKDQLHNIEKELQEIDAQLSDPNIFTDQALYQKLMRRRAEIHPVAQLGEELDSVERTISESKDVLEKENDEELRSIAKDELAQAEKKQEELLEKLKRELLPKDPHDTKNVIMEVRAGVGGVEAHLFAEELGRMYMRYAEQNRFNAELIDRSAHAEGGIREMVFRIVGHGAYSRFKYESGVHRVQRVPVTEASGRVHTSTATVAVLPEAEEVDVEIKPEDIEVEVCRSSGAGGQSVNTTDSAVRIRHKKTGIVVRCQDERSQLKNKTKALRHLRSKLLAYEEERQRKERGAMRSSQIGTGDRSEKIRTYNFPQDRVTDHRIKQNFHNLPKIMEGDLDAIVEELVLADQAKKMATVL